MHISISYPPLESEKGIPLLSQNRQFQWFSNPTYIYPVVPAYAASLMQHRGHEVFWDDGIAEELTYSNWLARLKDKKPEVIALESKTPVIKRHWRIVDELKKSCDWNPQIILYGDHLTALPEESMSSCNVDYVVTGGDFDFVLADLCDYIAAPKEKSLPKGVWYRQENLICNTGGPDLSHDLNDLPYIDRDLTKWELYAYKNGNFKFTPGTYVMTGRDCWWGRCSFCSWTTLCPGDSYRTVSVERHLDEVQMLIDKYGVREIFDDSGCFPQGKWLDEFCEGLIARGLNKKAIFGCNMRCGALSQEQFNLMKQANFRFVLFGLESINQSTLDRLTKGVKVEQIGQTLRMAKKACLEPHVTTMVGYPWESKADAEQTIAFAKKMFVEGVIDSLQATIVVPYPGTPMFDEARKNDWLLTVDWDDFDMKQSVWKSEVSSEDVKGYTQELYRAALSPRFILRKLRQVRRLDDLKFYWRAGLKLIGHLVDFSRKKA